LLTGFVTSSCDGFQYRFDGFCLDLDLWCRLLRAGGLYMLDETLCGFRVSRQSWSASIAHRQPREFAQFVEDLHGRGVPLSAFDRASGRLRAYMNAFLRLGMTRVLLLGSRI